MDNNAVVNVRTDEDGEYLCWAGHGRTVIMGGQTPMVSVYPTTAYRDFVLAANGYIPEDYRTAGITSFLGRVLYLYDSFVTGWGLWWLPHVRVHPLTTTVLDWFSFESLLPVGTLNLFEWPYRTMHWIGYALLLIGTSAEGVEQLVWLGLASLLYFPHAAYLPVLCFDTIGASMGWFQWCMIAVRTISVIAHTLQYDIAGYDIDLFGAMLILWIAIMYKLYDRIFARETAAETYLPVIYGFLVLLICYL
jgi:hypothetical protein